MADKFKLSRKAKKIILGVCIGGVVVLTAGLFTYIHMQIPIHLEEKYLFTGWMFPR